MLRMPYPTRVIFSAPALSGPFRTGAEARVLGVCRPWLSSLLKGVAVLALSACATVVPDPTGLAPVLARLPSSGVVLMGEQHDAPDHQRLQRELAQTLSAQGRLAAVVLEMAEAGRTTQGLANTSTEEQVRAALAWSDDAWPWKAYGPGVMASVRAGVAVWGANLPRAQLREAMTNTDLDARLNAEEWREQESRMDLGHCGLLPATQWRPMGRVQTARDLRMATVAQGLVKPGQLVLVWTGSEHADRQLGIPRFLGDTPVLSVRMAAGGEAANTTKRHDLVIATAPTPARDHCAELRATMRPPVKPSPEAP